MPVTYEVEGQKYQFPEDFTDAQAQKILTDQGIIKPAPGLFERAKSALGNIMSLVTPAPPRELGQQAPGWPPPEARPYGPVPPPPEPGLGERVGAVAKGALGNVATIVAEMAKSGITPGALPIGPPPGETATQTQQQAGVTAKALGETPMLPVSKLLPENPTDTPFVAATRGVLKGVESMTTPVSASILMAVPGLGAAMRAGATVPAQLAYDLLDTGLTGYFTSKGAEAVVGSGKAAYDKWQQKDYKGAAEDLGFGSVNALFTYLLTNNFIKNVGNLGNYQIGMMRPRQPGLPPGTEVPPSPTPGEPPVAPQLKMIEGVMVDMNQPPAGFMTGKGPTAAPGTAAPLAALETAMPVLPPVLPNKDVLEIRAVVDSGAPEPVEAPPEVVKAEAATVPVRRTRAPQPEAPPVRTPTTKVESQGAEVPSAEPKKDDVYLQDFVATRGGFAEPAHMIIRSNREVTSDEIRTAFFPGYQVEVQKLRADPLLGALQPGRQPFRIQFFNSQGQNIQTPAGIEERLGLASGEQYHAPLAVTSTPVKAPALELPPVTEPSAGARVKARLAEKQAERSILGATGQATLTRAILGVDQPELHKVEPEVSPSEELKTIEASGFQPWELEPGEFSEWLAHVRGGLKPFEVPATVNEWHRQRVEQAVMAGKVVPSDVLNSHDSTQKYIKEELTQGDFPDTTPEELVAMQNLEAAQEAAAPVDAKAITVPWMLPQAAYVKEAVKLGAAPDAAAALHETEVWTALKTGQPVPYEVLAEYPKLLAKVAPSGRQEPLPESQVQKQYLQHHEEYGRWLTSILDKPIETTKVPGHFEPGTTVYNNYIREKLPRKFGDFLSFESWLSRKLGRPVPPGQVNYSITQALVNDKITRVLEFAKGGVQGEKGALVLTKENIDNVNADLTTFGFQQKWVFTLLQVAEANPNFAPIQSRVKHTQEWWTTRILVEAKADATIHRWAALGKRGEALGKLLFEVNRESEREKRRLTPEELQAVADRLGADSDVLEVFNRIDRDFADVLAAIKKQVLLEAARNPDKDPALQGKAITKINRDFARLENRNYFPATRFGKYAVRVKAKGKVEYHGKKFRDGMTIYFATTELRFQQKSLLKAALSEFADATKYAVSKSDLPDANISFQGFPPALFESMKTALNLSEVQTEQFKEIIRDLLPGRAFAKHLGRRHMVGGYSLEAQRVYASYMQSAAGHVARLQHRWDLEQDGHDALTIKKEIERVGGDAEGVSRLHNWMQDHNKYLMDPGPELGWLRGAMFMWYFAFVPKQAVVNLFQVPMNVPVYLAGIGANDPRFNLPTGKADAIAFHEVGKAIIAVGRMANFKALVPFWKGRGEPFPETSDRLSAEEVTLRNKAYAEGFMNESYATEVAGVAHGSPLLRLIPGVEQINRVIRATVSESTLWFRVAEEYNRNVTFLASLRFARRAGFTLDEAYEFAKKAVEKTQFEYARWNRPQIMRGRKAALFIFQLYNQHAWHLGFHGPKGVRWRWWMMMALLAGGLGLPFGRDILDILSGVGTMAKRWKPTRTLIGGVPYKDLEKDLHEYLTQIGANPELVLHGISRYFLGFDLSASLSMGNLIPFGAPRTTRKVLEGTVTFPGVLTQAVVGLMGAAGSAGMGLGQAVLDNNVDSFQALKKFPGAIKNGAKFWEAVTEGKATNSRGETLVEYDLHKTWDVAEIIGQLLGATPTRVSKATESRAMFNAAQQYYATRREMLMHDWAVASKDAAKNREAVADVRAATRDFNAGAPPGTALTGRQIIDSVLQRSKNESLRNLGLPTQKTFRGLYRDYQQAVPQK